MTATLSSTVANVAAGKAFWPSLPTAAAATLAVVETTPLTIALLGIVSSLTVALVGWRQSVTHEQIEGTAEFMRQLQARLQQEIEESRHYRELHDKHQEAYLDLQRVSMHKDIGLWTLSEQIRRLGAEPEWSPGEDL